MSKKVKVHFTDKYLIAPTNPVIVNVIGAGGTGSQVLSALARINHALTALRHAGLFVRVYDDDMVTPANIGRQLFSQAEVGMNKGAAQVNRLNRFYGTNWKALPHRYSKDNAKKQQQQAHANITISCVDTAAARFEIAALLSETVTAAEMLSRPLYWMDFGNSLHTGQMVLSTVGEISQPGSKKYTPVGFLPFVTDEFEQLLRRSENEDNTPSCSLAEALTRQDLFINSTLAHTGAALLWQLFREGMIRHRGFFLNLKDFRMQPIAV